MHVVVNAKTKTHTNVYTLSLSLSFHTLTHTHTNTHACIHTYDSNNPARSFPFQVVTKVN